MTINPATASVSAYPGASDGASRLPAQMLDQEDFLRLLVTQMTSQDPLNPKADLDSIAQMAQFSSLEQTRAMQADIALLRGQQQLLQADGLLGRTVELQLDSQITVRGVVEAVQIQAGTPRIVVGGVPYTLEQVLAIAPTPPADQP